MNTVTPEQAGFSSERLRRLDAAMQRYVDQGKIAGIVTVAARPEAVVQCGIYGKANIAADQPMRDDTMFRIYSMTKPITSVAALMLYEQGDLRLSDPVAKYIPAFTEVQVLEDPDAGGTTVPPTRPPTVHDLLTHTAGLSYGFDQNSFLDRLYQERVWGPQRTNPEATLAMLVGELARLPLAHQPGTQFRYSMATDVLGYLVEVVSGMPFSEFLQQRIFTPLDMTDTSFHVPAEKQARFAANYGPGEDGSLKVIDDPATSHYMHQTQTPSGGGGLVSTAPDYLRFAQMLLNKGEFQGTRLLGRKTVELMTMNHLPDGVHPFGNPAEGFGLGVSVLENVAKTQRLGSVGNYGWGGAANTFYWGDPQEGLIGLLMLQYMPSGTHPVIADFQTLLYQALE